MNSKIVIFGVIAVFCISSLAYGFPVEEDEELVDVSAPTRFRREISDIFTEEFGDVSAPVIRHKRATCDLLSGFGVGDSACAAHCIAIGRSGGHCNSQAVCVCRS